MQSRGIDPKDVAYLLVNDDDYIDLLKDYQGKNFAQTTFSSSSDFVLHGIPIIKSPVVGKAEIFTVMKDMINTYGNNAIFQYDIPPVVPTNKKPEQQEKKQKSDKRIIRL